MKRSAGVLAYKIEDNDIKVLLCHFGGPYWKGKDVGGWSIPKGELNKAEKNKEAAKREFLEETNLVIDVPIKYLGTKKVSRNKLVIMFCINSDFCLDDCKSNTFNLEIPKGSGNFQKFPEMDNWKWMSIGEAKSKIINSQLYFLNKLEQMLIRK